MKALLVIALLSLPFIGCSEDKDPEEGLYLEFSLSPKSISASLFESFDVEVEVTTWPEKTELPAEIEMPSYVEWTDGGDTTISSEADIIITASSTPTLGYYNIGQGSSGDSADHTLHFACIDTGTGEEITVFLDEESSASVSVDCVSGQNNNTSNQVSDESDDVFDPAVGPGSTITSPEPIADLTGFTGSWSPASGTARADIHVEMEFAASFPDTLPSNLSWLNCQLLVMGASGQGPQTGDRELLGSVGYRQADVQGTGISESAARWNSTDEEWTALVGGADWFSVENGKLVADVTGYGLLTLLGADASTVDDDLALKVTCTYNKDGQLAQDEAGPIVLRGLGALLKDG